EREGMLYERTPLLSRQEAEQYGAISSSRLGLSQDVARDRSFADEALDPKTLLFSPIELSDTLGRRYLVWKVEDQPPRVPLLDEIRAQVVAAWKLEQARPLARQAAEALAEKARKQGGDLPAVAGDRKVITTEPVTKLHPSSG